MHKSKYLLENKLDYNIQIRTRHITALTVPKMNVPKLSVLDQFIQAKIYVTTLDVTKKFSSMNS